MKEAVVRTAAAAAAAGVIYMDVGVDITAAAAAAAAVVRRRWNVPCPSFAFRVVHAHVTTRTSCAYFVVNLEIVICTKHSAVHRLRGARCWRSRSSSSSSSNNSTNSQGEENARHYIPAGISIIVFLQKF